VLIAASAVSEFRTSCARSAAFPEITFPATSVTKFLFWREHSRDFESMTAYGFAFFGLGVNLTGAGEPEHLRSLVSVRTSSALWGYSPCSAAALRRTKMSCGPNFCCTRYALWQRRFGGDSGIVGRPIRLGGQLWTVVGVAIKEFTFTPTADVGHCSERNLTQRQTNVCNVPGGFTGSKYAASQSRCPHGRRRTAARNPRSHGSDETVAIRSYQMPLWETCVRLYCSFWSRRVVLLSVSRNLAISY